MRGRILWPFPSLGHFNLRGRQDRQDECVCMYAVPMGVLMNPDTRWGLA